jgi:hypothetical protein
VVFPAPECVQFKTPPQSPVAQDPLPELSKVHFRRPQILPADHVAGTVVVAVAPGSNSIPPEEVPLKTGTVLPDPATQTVSEQLFLTVNVRVWAAAEATTMAMMSRNRTACFFVLYEPSFVFTRVPFHNYE